MASLSCTLCDKTVYTREDPFYESHSWELESKIITPYREIKLPKKYNEVNLYKITICQKCESIRGWHAQVMQKINLKAAANQVEKIRAYTSRMNDTLREVSEWETKLKNVERLQFD